MTSHEHGVAQDALLYVNVNGLPDLCQEYIIRTRAERPSLFVKRRKSKFQFFEKKKKKILEIFIFNSKREWRRSSNSGSLPYLHLRIHGAPPV